MRATSVAMLRSAQERNEPVVIQSVEGAHFLEGRLDRLEAAYDRGLRHLTLLHDNDAWVPLGDVYTNPVRFGGLTAFGKDVIRECGRLGILVDLSHGSNETVNAALNLSDNPIQISHTGLDTQLGSNESMNEVMRPRLISKEQAKIVADSGGVIGVWTRLADTPIAYAKNILAMVDVVGVEHVCIGTDSKLTPAYRSLADARPNPGESRQPDGNKHGDQQRARQSNRNRGDEGTNATWRHQQDYETGFFYTVVEAMLNTGFTPQEIDIIAGENFCRVFAAATSGH